MKATSDPLSATMQRMNSRLTSKSTSSFHNAIRNNTIIRNDASSTLTPASRIDSRISRARR